MKKYKKLFVPPIKNDFGSLQRYYCDCAIKCCTNCNKCIYHGDNKKLFKEWHDKKQLKK